MRRACADRVQKRKAIHTCVWCDKPIYYPIEDTDGGPIVGVTSGFMHWPCRRKQFRQQLIDEAVREQDIHNRRMEAGRKLAEERTPASVQRLCLQMHDRTERNED